MAIFQCPRCGDEFETEYALGGHDCGAAPAMTVDALVPPDILLPESPSPSEWAEKTFSMTPQQRWRAKNKDKHRAYMREYMRRYRAKKGAVVDIKA